MKTKVIATVVLVLALWPALHILLASRYQIDPWEFLGWGMYALPSPQVHVRMEQLILGRSVIVRPSDATTARLNEFAAARTRFGLFASVDALGAEILTLEPQMQGVMVILRRWELDRKTARFDFQEQRYRFER